MLDSFVSERVVQKILFSEKMINGGAVPASFDRLSPSSIGPLLLKTEFVRDVHFEEQKNYCIPFQQGDNEIWCQIGEEQSRDECENYFSTTSNTVGAYNCSQEFPLFLPRKWKLELIPLAQSIPIWYGVEMHGPWDLQPHQPLGFSCLNISRLFSQN